MSIMAAESMQDLQAAISMKSHLLCLNNIPTHLDIKKPENKGNVFYTIISYWDNPVQTDS